MKTSNVTINNKEISTERKEYLAYCEREALNIFNKLKIDILEDIIVSSDNVNICFTRQLNII